MAWTNLTFAYGSVLTSTKMTQVYDNMVAIAPLYASGNFGTLISVTTHTATNATWAPNASTKTMVVIAVGGGGSGGGGYGGGGGGGGGGSAGLAIMSACTTVSGTYNAQVGAAATNSSFTGTGISVTGAAG